MRRRRHVDRRFSVQKLCKSRLNCTAFAQLLHDFLQFRTGSYFDDFLGRFNPCLRMR